MTQTQYQILKTYKSLKSAFRNWSREYKYNLDGIKRKTIGLIQTGNKIIELESHKGYQVFVYEYAPETHRFETFKLGIEQESFQKTFNNSDDAVRYMMLVKQTIESGEE